MAKHSRRRQESRTEQSSQQPAKRLDDALGLLTRENPAALDLVIRRALEARTRGEKQIAEHLPASAPEPPPPVIKWNEPHYSSKRKRKRITIEGTLTSGDLTIRNLQISLTGSPDDVQHAARYYSSDAGGGVLRLGGDLVNGLHQAARVVPRVIRRAWRKWINEVAAAVYLYVQDQDARPGGLGRALRKAEKTCAARVPDWKAYPRAEQRILLTAFLVHHAHQQEWNERKLADPLAEPGEIESFYVHYIKPELRAVKDSLGLDAEQPSPRQAAQRLVLAEGSDARLRPVLAPWRDPSNDDGSAAVRVFRRAYRRPSRRRSRRS